MTAASSRDLGAGSEVSLTRLLGQVERRTARRVEAALSGRALSLDQWRVIDLLADGQGRTMSELSSVLLVPGPTMTKLVDRLVDAATVYRAVDDRDRRRVVVRLSEAGTELRDALRGPVRDAERAVLDELREDAAVFVELLERLERAGPA